MYTYVMHECVHMYNYMYDICMYVSEMCDACSSK